MQENSAAEAIDFCIVGYSRGDFCSPPYSCPRGLTGLGAPSPRRAHPGNVLPSEWCEVTSSSCDSVRQAPLTDGSNFYFSRCDAPLLLQAPVGTATQYLNCAD